MKFNKNPSSGSRVAPCGRTDSNDEAESRFKQFCERVLKNHRMEITGGLVIFNTNRQGITQGYWR